MLHGMDDFFCTLAIITAENWRIWAGLAAAAVTGVTVYDKIDAIRHRNKQSPPNHEVFAKKEELKATEKRLNSRIDKTMGGIKTQLDQMNTSMQAEFRSMNRSLGRLEGKDEKTCP